MQVFTSLGKPWDRSARPLVSRFPIELLTLFSFVFVAQLFIDECAYSVIIHVLWTALVYLAYLVRSHANSERFNRELGLDIDEIVELFRQLPNAILLQDVLFGDSSTDWINSLLVCAWPNLQTFFARKFKQLALGGFLTLENFSIGASPPLIESLRSSLVSHNHEHTLTLNFNLYWFANSETGGPSDSEPLTSLKCFHYSIGSLISFCFKANCQMQFRFRQWQLNEEPQLIDVRCSFTQTPSLTHLHTTGLLWLLDNLQLVRPIVCAYLKRFQWPKRAVFKLTTDASTKPRRPPIGCPTALFCIDMIQAENVPLSKCRRAKPQADFGQPERQTSEGRDVKQPSNQIIQQEGSRVHHRAQHKSQQGADQGTKHRNEVPGKQRAKSTRPISVGKQTNKQTEQINRIDTDRSSKRCKLFKCLSYRLPSAYCRVKIFNHQFTCPPATSTTNPLWNFRSFVPIFSHSDHSIEQLNRYQALVGECSERNPIDLNASFYQLHHQSSHRGTDSHQSPDGQPEKTKDKQTKNIRQFISYEFLQNLSVTIQLFDRQTDQDKLIGEFQICDPSQYFLDAESNGQSIWLNAASVGVLAKDTDLSVKQSVKLNVRFTFLTLSQSLSPVFLSNAYLANRMAFPIGMLALFLDSAIGMNIELFRSKLNPKIEYGYQIVCQLGNQTLYSSICTDLSFIWENEMLFCVHSLRLQSLLIKLVARSLNASNYDSTTLTTNQLDLSDLTRQPIQQQYFPLFFKPRPPAHLKLLLTFRLIQFTGKLTANCLRNAKVAEEDALVRQKQLHGNEKLKPVKQPAEEEPTGLISKLHMKTDEELSDHVLEIDPKEIDANEEIDPKDSVKQPEAIKIVVNVRMRWPKAGKLVVEIVDLKCGKLLTLFQMYSIQVYLIVVLREKEKALQSKRTSHFQLKSSTVAVNQELQFTCISKPLSAYHLNVSLHEKRTEEYSKVAEVYCSLPPLILASGQIEQRIVLNLTPMYLKTCGMPENAAFSPEYELDHLETTTRLENEPTLPVPSAK